MIPTVLASVAAKSINRTFTSSSPTTTTAATTTTTITIVDNNSSSSNSSNFNKDAPGDNTNINLNRNDSENDEGGGGGGGIDENQNMANRNVNPYGYQPPAYSTYPQQNMYGPQQPGYGPAQPMYGPLQPGYGPPQPMYGPQQPGYGPQQPGYGPQQPGYGPPQYQSSYTQQPYQYSGTYSQQPGGVWNTQQQSSAQNQQGYWTGNPNQQQGQYVDPNQTDTQGVKRPSIGDYITDPQGVKRPSIGDYINISSIEYIDYFEDPMVRQAFIRKVYMIVCVQLLFCFGWIFACVFVEPINEYLRRHMYIALFFGLGYIIVSTVIHCCCWQAFTTHPTDILLLFIETVLLAGFAGPASIQYSPKVVLLAFCTTIFLTLVLTILAFQTRIDFTQWAGVLAVAVLSVFLFAIVGGLLLPLVFGVFIPALHLVVACIFVIFLCAFIVIDTQMLMRNKSLSLSPHMYCFAASQIFSDIVLLFLYLLQIFSICDDSS